MGTRNLTAVFVDGEYKVAQYGQWDGCPEGAGLAVLDFCRNITDPIERAKFKDKVRKCSWWDEDELVTFMKRSNISNVSNWQSIYPELSRNTGANILSLINGRSEGLKLKNDLDFAADSVFCEWAWVVDLDTNTFEGYKGFNHKPLTERDRFHFLEKYSPDGCYGVCLKSKWSIDDLPSNVDFLFAFQ